jgi:hypothetical protein
LEGSLRIHVKTLGRLAAAAAIAMVWAQLARGASAAIYGSMAKASLGVGASLHGAVPFPAAYAWNTDISAAPTDPNSAALIAAIGLNAGLHPDFGSGLYDGAIIGIPYVVVSKAQPYVDIHISPYASQSDPGPYPVPPKAPIEGSRPDGGAFGGDRHVLVIDRDTNRLFEMYFAYPLTSGAWRAQSGAVFDLDSDNPRPRARPGWTSADAAGLPVFPGLVRYDEASAGLIAHALRFTVARTRAAFVPPATHWASSSTSPDLPPMGMRVRLKAAYVIPSSFSQETRTILQALKTHGMFVADNGSDWFISGAPDKRWNNDRLVSELGQVKGSNFEVVKMVGLRAAHSPGGGERRRRRAAGPAVFGGAPPLTFPASSLRGAPKSKGSPRCRSPPSKPCSIP